MIRIRDIWTGEKWINSQSKIIQDIIDNIPIEWKETLENYIIEPKPNTYWDFNGLKIKFIEFINFDQALVQYENNVEREEIIQFNNRFRPVDKIDSKFIFKDIKEYIPKLKFEKISKIRHHLQLQQLFINKNHLFWNFKIEKVMKWTTISKHIWKCPVDPKFNEIYYKLINRALWIGERFEKLKMNRDFYCKICQDFETIEHVFVKCQIAQIVLKLVRNLLQQINITIKMNLKFILNGGVNVKSSKFRSLTKCLHRIALFTIWTCRNNLVHQDCFCKLEIVNLFKKTLLNSIQNFKKIDADLVQNLSFTE